MPMLRWLWIFILLAGCTLPSTTPTSIPPQTTPAQAPAPTMAAWEPIAPGLEQRLFRAQSDLPLLHAVRVDPTQVRFRAVYRPGDPLTLAGWRDALPNAQVILNANFFTPEHTALGLLISDGIVYGTPYRDRGGAFVIENGLPRITNNRREPYSGQPWQQAVQAFPLLVWDASATYTNANDRRIARRSAVAMDAQGRVLLLATPGLGLTLPALSQTLAELDADIQTALNLDGGGSTMLYVAPADLTLPSFDPVPAVLALYPQ